MVELADKIHSPIEHDCTANDDCDGVLCVADISSDTYFLEFLILSCEDPPALDILLKDSDGNALFSAVVTDTYYGTLPAGDFVIVLQANVVHYNYSMDIQVSIGHINYTMKCSYMHIYKKNCWDLNPGPSKLLPGSLTQIVTNTDNDLAPQGMTYKACYTLTCH